MSTNAAGSSAPRVRRGARHFLLHYGEMVLAMYVGMLALGAVFALVLAAAGRRSRMPAMTCRCSSPSSCVST